MARRITVERNIAVFWKNDGYAGFMMSMSIPDDASDLVEAMRNLYLASCELLRDEPVRAKAHMIAEVEEFAARYNAQGRPNYTDQNPKDRAKAVAIMMKVAALERCGMIVIDDFTGVVTSFSLEEHILH